MKTRFLGGYFPAASSTLSVTLAVTLYFGSPCALHSQDKSEGEAGKSAVDVADASSASPFQTSLLFEYYEVDHRTANRMVREFSPRAANAGELREQLVALVDEGRATLVETGWIRALDGKRSLSGSFRESIYATEYDPAEIPTIVGGTVSYPVAKKQESSPQKSSALKPEVDRGIRPDMVMTSANPTAFETRNVGLTIEVDPVISEDEAFVDLSMASEIVSHVGDEFFLRPGYEDRAAGTDHIFMPLFYQMSCVIRLTAIPGKYSLIGLHAPHGKKDKRILVLVRTDIFRANSK